MYHFMTCKLDEWDICSYTIIPCLLQIVDIFSSPSKTCQCGRKFELQHLGKWAFRVGFILSPIIPTGIYCAIIGPPSLLNETFDKETYCHEWHSWSKNQIMSCFQRHPNHVYMVRGVGFHSPGGIYNWSMWCWVSGSTLHYTLCEHVR